jgi:hypothetical protein
MPSGSNGAVDDTNPWKGIRYRTVTNTGQLWSTPLNKVLFLQAGAWTQPQSAAFYDHTRYPQNFITRLNATAESESEKWPPADVTVPIENGVYVSFSQSALLTGFATIGWLP